MGQQGTAAAVRLFFGLLAREENLALGRELLAERYGAIPLIVRCHCSQSVALRRIQDRLALGRSISEATIDTYRHQQQSEEPAPLHVSSLNVDTNAAVPAMLDELVARLRPMTEGWWGKCVGVRQKGEPP